MFFLLHPAPHPDLLLSDSGGVHTSRRYHRTSLPASFLFPTLPTRRSQCGDFLTFDSPPPLRSRVYAPVRLPKKFIN